MTLRPTDTDDALTPGLDAALGRVLSAPPLPEGFHHRLQAATLALAAQELARKREAVEAEHARQLAALQRSYVLLTRNTLAQVLAVAFGAGMGGAWALHGLREATGVDLSWLTPLLAVGIGMAVGSMTWIDRFGAQFRAPTR